MSKARYTGGRIKRSFKDIHSFSILNKFILLDDLLSDCHQPYHVENIDSHSITKGEQHRPVQLL